MATLQSRIVKGITYWAIVTSKRVNGKPRPVVLDYIGNDAKLKERLLSKSIFTENISLKSYSHGDTTALLKIVEKLGVEEILDEVLGKTQINGIKKSTALILIAIGRACNPTSKNAYADWYKTTTLKDVFNIDHNILDCDFLCKQMLDITEKQLEKAEDLLTKKILELYKIDSSKLSLDYTNYFTYISSNNENCDLAQRGKNKQKRNDLRQFSLAVVTAKELPIPLYTYTYEGNKNDITAFEEYIAKLKTRIPDYDKQQLTLIFDGGSVSKENLKIIDNHFICRFPLSSCKELYDIDIVEYGKIKLKNKKEVTYKRIDNKEIWGRTYTSVLTYSEELFESEVKELENNISKAIIELNEIKEKLTKGKTKGKKKNISEENIKGILKGKVKEIIEIDFTKTDDKITDISVKENHTKKEEIKNKYFGKRLIITDRVEWTDEEILQAYRDQETIENVIKTSKNKEHNDMRPQRHYKEQKVRVHIYTCLLGQTLTSVLNKEMQLQGIEISDNKLLDTLASIREDWVKQSNNNTVYKKLEELEEEQERLWLAVNNISKS